MVGGKHHTLLGKDYYAWSSGNSGAVAPPQSLPQTADAAQHFEYELAQATKAAAIRVRMMTKADELFRKQNLTAIRAPFNLTAAEQDRARQINDRYAYINQNYLIDDLQQHFINDDEASIAEANRLYNPVNETPCIEIFTRLARSDFRHVSAVAHLRLAQMQSGDREDQKRLCRTAAAELADLYIQNPAIHDYRILYREAEDRMVTLLQETGTRLSELQFVRQGA